MNLSGAEATKSRAEKLEKINKGLEKVEKQLDKLIELKRNVRFLFLLVFGLSLIGSSVYLCMTPDDSTPFEKFQRSLPMILSSVVIYCVWIFLTRWCFNLLMRQKEGRIEILEREKDRLLNWIWESQTYLGSKSPFPSAPSQPGNVVVMGVNPNQMHVKL